jgi:hypothetical protein
MDRRRFLKTSMLATGGARVAAWLANPVPTANAAESQRALPDEGPLVDFGKRSRKMNEFERGTK